MGENFEVEADAARLCPGELMMEKYTLAPRSLQQYLRAEIPFSQALFSSGDLVFSPILSWEWFRYPTDAEMQRQLDAAKNAGFGAVYVLPMPLAFRPHTMVTELEGYLSPDYFDRVRTALQYADAIGLRIWLYDEGGWPSGSACGKVLETLPDRRGVRLYADEKGSLRLEETSGSYPDVYDETAALCFTCLTHHAYAKALGDLSEKTEAMFTDEPAGAADAVNDRLLAAFRETYGFEMGPFLPALLAPDVADEAGKKARQDYYALLGKQFVRTLEIYRDACHAHGWLSVGHLDRDHTVDSNLTKGYGNTLQALKALDIPGVDTICGQIRSSDCKTDGNAAAFYPRFASSAAVQTGGTLALSESFAVYGNALSGDEMRYILNYQLVRGINLFNFMTMPSTLQGWYAYSERPYFHPDIPGFFALDSLCKEIERSCLFMATGLHAAQTALFYPYTEFLAGGTASAWAIKAFCTAGDALEADGVDFDVIDADTILASSIEDGLLRAGSAAYSNVVVPEGCNVPENVGEKLSFLTGKARRFVQTSERAFLHRTVREKNGDLHFCVFNQSCESKTAKIHFETELPLYRCDPKTGDFQRIENDMPITLTYGQCALFFASETDVAAASPVQYSAELELRSLSSVKTAEFRLSEEGAELATASGALPLAGRDAVLPGDFCGEAAFSYSFTFDHPTACVLSLKTLHFFAEVFVNGMRAGSICTAPYQVMIPRVFFRAGENELTLKVATLVASAYVKSMAERFFDQKHLGPYHAPALGFEREVPYGGGFTGLRLLCENPALVTDCSPELDQ